MPIILYFICSKKRFINYISLKILKKERLLGNTVFENLHLKEQLQGSIYFVWDFSGIIDS